MSEIGSGLFAFVRFVRHVLGFFLFLKFLYVPGCFLFFSVECLSRAVFCSLTSHSIVLRCFRSFLVAWRCSVCYVVFGCFRIVLSFASFLSALSG